MKPFFPNCVNPSPMSQIELSIIVPLLNERDELPEFLPSLQAQQQVEFELLFVDGGSSDGSLEWLRQKRQIVLESEAGRARQMNLGAEQAQAEWLLFLHVDSRFEDLLTLRRGLDALQLTGSRNVAGHFPLKFRRSDASPSAGYYFYEWKARLGRPETIHGDQGFLLSFRLYRQLEGFCEDLPVMEDTDFAERLRQVGQWLLLPDEISTSARRFETEGLWQRQLLGALIMCFRDIGFEQFFAAASDVYRQQNKTEKLLVRPFFTLVRHLHAAMGWRNAWRIWWQGGCYVRRHAWQLTFAVDARRAFRLGVPVGQGNARVTRWCEPVYDLLTDNLLGRAAATLLLRAWFEMTDAWLLRKETES